VGLAAIVVVGAESEAFCSTARQEQKTLLEAPLACVEILGRSMIERTIERFVHAGVEAVSVLVSAEVSHEVQLFSSGNGKVQVVPDMCSGIARQLLEYSQSGIEHSFVVSASVHAETDLLDLFYFHREAQQTATRARDHEGFLDLWVVDCAKGPQADLENLLTRGEGTGASYFIREYVNRLTHPRDLRRLASDALQGRCAMRPSGREIKAGIWIDEGAEVHRLARVVTPAYVGRGSKVQQDSLITRCSSIEKSCYVDCGTVIEDSAILANTHIGIWLDVRHAIANGNKLLSLERDVVLEISDPSVMRSNGLVRKESKNTLGLSQRDEERQSRDLEQEESPTPRTWRLGTNPVEG
jgi:NDP-sugar pyrophosphorylase family protein